MCSRLLILYDIGAISDPVVKAITTSLGHANKWTHDVLSRVEVCLAEWLEGSSAANVGWVRCPVMSDCDL